MINVVQNFLTDSESASICSIDVTNYGRKVWDVQESNSDVKVKRANIKPYVKELINKHNIPYTCAVELLTYLPGSMSSPHLDVMGSHYDSSSIHRVAQWSKTGIVLLNDEFEGGELYFPNLGLMFGREHKNSLIEFSAGEIEHYVHGVYPVTSGIRYTLIFRWE